MAAERQEWRCPVCSWTEVEDDDDTGKQHCQKCFSLVDDYVQTGNADEDFVATGSAAAAVYSAAHTRKRPPSAAAVKAEPISQPEFWTALTLEDPDVKAKVEDPVGGDFSDAVGPTGPEDFGWIGTAAPTFEDYYNEVRIKYAMGLQLMVEFQCEALVRDFEVSPLVCSLAGTVWLRLLAWTGIFSDRWVDDAINESESQQQGDPPEDFKPRYKYSAEPHNMFGQRAVMIWLSSLKRKIPLPYTLAVSFLACHLAREPVLTTDIEKWSVEGKLPYFSAFVEIQNRIGGKSRACPVSSSLMFRPIESVTAQKLESLAAFIAQSIGLSLPPVNFYAISLRYVQKLSLPVDKILPHALRVYEWSMPPDLWLSSNERRLPTRVAVMSILIVAIRICYNINGFGFWEKSFTSKETKESEVKLGPDVEDNVGNNSNSSQDSDNSGGNPLRNTPSDQKPDFDATELLCDLYTRYNAVSENYEYSKDLPTYLQFCKDVVFAGLEPSFEDNQERKLIDTLWDIYRSEKDTKTEVQEELTCRTAEKQKKARIDEGCTNDKSQSEESSQDGDSSEHNDHDESTRKVKYEAVRQLKVDMEENRFHYIPPRVYLKRFDYLHYTRKQNEGVLSYVAHADYYILLRACAKVAEIEIRLMHMGVLGFERRLGWIEQRINHCLHLKPPSYFCEFCSVRK